MPDRRFGSYLCLLRQARGYTLREFARRLGISPSYYNDLEKGRRLPPDYHYLERISALLGLSEAEKEKMYDLAGEEAGRIAPDVAAYLIQRREVQKFIRTAMRVGAVPEDWSFLEKVLLKKLEM